MDVKASDRATSALLVSKCLSMEPQVMGPGAGADLIERFEKLSLGYTEARGCPHLRREIASMYESVPEDGPLSPVVAAPQECVLLAMLALLKPGMVVVAMQPAYQSLYSVAKWLGCTVVTW